MVFLVTFSFSNFKNTVYNTYNIENMWSLTVYIICKASGQQEAISYVLGESKVMLGFSTASFKGQLC